MSELYWPSDRRLSVKVLPTFVDRGCYVVSTAYPLWLYSRISRPEPLLFLSSSSSSCAHGAEWTPFQTHHLEKSGSAANQTQTSG
jgi:hypothetical protein